MHTLKPENALTATGNVTHTHRAQKGVNTLAANVSSHSRKEA